MTANSEPLENERWKIQERKQFLEGAISEETRTHAARAERVGLGGEEAFPPQTQRMTEDDGERHEDFGG